MPSLKITLTDGTTTEHRITPAVEFAFEVTHNIGFHKAFRDREQQSDLYWLAWECLRRDGAPDVKPFGDKFLETLKAVEVLGDEYPNG